MQKNQVVEALCEALGSEQEGICRVDGQVLFVPGALPGELIQTRIVKLTKSYGFGRLEAVLTPSADRVTPPCPYFPRCGGCTGQHLAYKASLEAKRRQVADCLERIGGLENPQISPVLGMQAPWRYRNKGAFPIGGEPGRPKVGCYAARSHNLIDAPGGCLLQSETSDALVGAVRAWAAECGVPPYNEERHEGLLRHVMTREAADGSAMLVLAINGQSVPQPDRLIQLARRAAPTLRALMLAPNTRRTNVILGDTVKTLWGEDSLIDQVMGFSMRVSPRAFFQVNHSQTETLYRLAVDACSLTGDELVFDLYCGCGSITLPLAKQARLAVGVEIVEDAVADARENALRNGVANAEFLAGAAETLLPEAIRRYGAPDALVLDPPRKGCDPQVLDAIAQARPARVVYVSCNPATLARDAGHLCHQGYRLVSAQPVDMFPWTGHVETVCLLSKLNTELHIEVDLELDELDLTSSESKATYGEIKESET